MLRYCVGNPFTHFLYDIVYQQQYKSRDSNAYLSDGSRTSTCLTYSHILDKRYSILEEQ